MLLAVDIGNTNTSLGVYDGPTLRCELRISTRRDWTRDEVAAAMVQVLALRGIALAEVNDAVIGSVVPPALPPMLAALQTYAGLDPLVIGPGIKTGMPLRYEPPQDVGADRVLSSVAAFARHGSKGTRGVIVVDLGTATTFDVVSPEPAYLGGVICPGIGISADALFARAAKLPRVSLDVPASVIGRNTASSIQSGLVHGHAAMVQGILERIEEELDWTATVVVTGGFGPFIKQACPRVDACEQDLVLEGLRLLHERNRKK